MLLDKQIKEHREKIKAYPQKEKRFYDLLSHDSVIPELVLKAVEKLRKEEEQDQRQLEQLERSRKNTGQHQIFKDKLSKIVNDLKGDYDGRETLEEKRDLLTSFDVRVTAIQGKYSFTCSIDSELNSNDFDESIDEQFRENLKEFETKYPEHTFSDIFDLVKELPYGSSNTAEICCK